MGRNGAPGWWQQRVAVAAAVAGLLLAAAALLRWDIAVRRDAFATDARIVHRLLSQRAVGIEAVAATLALGGPGPAAAAGIDRLRQRHPALASWRWRPQGQPWGDARLDAAEARARAAGHAVLAGLDVNGAARWQLVQPADGSALLLDIAAEALVPWADWPLDRAGPVRVELRHPLGRIVLQPGAPADARPLGWTDGFVFGKVLDAPGQPFEVHLQAATGPAQWPWGLLAALAAAGGAALWGAAAWRRQRLDRQRAEDLLRLGRLQRLNTLGEMAAGLAHELNQPLAAALASAQAARRRLDSLADAVPALAEGDAGDDLAAARDAVAQAAAQARRASDVVLRLRRQLQPAGASAAAAPVRLDDAVRQAVDLLEPEARRRGVQVHAALRPALVRADPVAIDQIVHNLLLNALQSFDAPPVPAAAAAGARERRIDLETAPAGPDARLTVADTGPGLAPQVLARLFQPFNTTRSDGLGLGLSLCETMAQGLGGHLAGGNRAGGGAEFRLTLPLADSTGPHA
jgi:signal transduction histidine kinase